MRTLLTVTFPALMALVLGFAGGIATTSPAAGPEIAVEAVVRPTDEPTDEPARARDVATPAPAPPEGGRSVSFAARAGATGANAVPATSVLRGRVRDVLGRAVEGAQIVALDDQGTVLARSDMGGLFKSSGSVSPGARLTARARSLDFEALTWDQGAVLDFVGSVRAPIELDVRLPGGRAPAEARVELDGYCAPFVSGGRSVDALQEASSDPRGGVLWDTVLAYVDGVRTWTPEQPVVATDGRALSAVVTAVMQGPAGEGDLRFRSEPIRIDPGLDGAGPHPVQLSPVSSLRVVLTDSTGQPLVENGWVTLARSISGASGDVELETALGTELDERRGVFLATGLAPGTYRLLAGRNGQPAAAIDEVAVPHGDVKREIVLPAVAEDKNLTLSITLPGGAAASSVAVQTDYAGQVGDEFQALDARGQVSIPWFRLFGEVDPGTTTGEVRVTCSVPGYGQRTATIEFPEPSLRLSFNAPASIVVVGAKESGRELTLSVRPLGTSGRLVDSGPTPDLLVNLPDEERPRVGPVQPGRYAITLRPASPDRNETYDTQGYVDSPFLARRAVTLNPGENLVRFAFEKRETLIVRYATEGRGPTFVVSPEGTNPGDPRFFRIRVRGVRGRAVVDDLPAGRYRVWTYNDGAPVVVAAQVPGPPVDFDGLLAGPVRVTSVVPGGAADGLGLREGDRLISAGTVSGADPAAVTAEIRNALTKALPLVLDRAGQRIEVSIGPFPGEYDLRAALGAEFLRFQGDS